MIEGRAAAALVPQYFDHLVAIHGFDFAGADLPAYAIAAPGTDRAALWQLNLAGFNPDPSELPDLATLCATARN